MIRPALFFLLLVSLLSISSCTEKENDETTIIFDKDVNIDSVKIYYFDLLSQKQIQIPKSINENTDIILDIKSSTYANLEVNDSLYNIYLEPGFKLRFSFLTNDKQKPKSDAELFQSYFRKLQTIFDNNYGYDFLKLDFNAFKKRNSFIEKSFNSVINDFNNENFKRVLVSYFETKMALQKLFYATVNYDLKSELNEETQYLLSSDDYKISDLEFGNNNIDASAFLDLYINSVIYPQISKNNISEPDNQLLKAIGVIKAANVDPKMREWLIAQSIYLKILSSGLDSVNISALENFQIEFENSNFITSLKELKSEAETLNPGTLIPNLSGITKDSTLVSLHDLKGKLVYLDIWATWCKPCIMEIPYSKKLEKHFQDDNIEFVYLSVDKVKADWNDFLIKHKFAGLHLLAKDRKKVYKELRLYGIPHYILIDEKSQIIDAYAPRPSNSELYKLIKQNLKSVVTVQ